MEPSDGAIEIDVTRPAVCPEVAERRDLPGVDLGAVGRRVEVGAVPECHLPGPTSELCVDPVIADRAVLELDIIAGRVAVLLVDIDADARAVLDDQIIERVALAREAAGGGDEKPIDARGAVAMQP